MVSGSTVKSRVQLFESGTSVEENVTSTTTKSIHPLNAAISKKVDLPKASTIQHGEKPRRKNSLDFTSTTPQTRAGQKISDSQREKFQRDQVHTKHSFKPKEPEARLAFSREETAASRNKLRSSPMHTQEDRDSISTRRQNSSPSLTPRKVVERDHKSIKSASPSRVRDPSPSWVRREAPGNKQNVENNVSALRQQQTKSPKYASGSGSPTSNTRVENLPLSAHNANETSGTLPRVWRSPAKSLPSVELVSTAPVGNSASTQLPSVDPHVSLIRRQFEAGIIEQQHLQNAVKPFSRVVTKPSQTMNDTQSTINSVSIIKESPNRQRSQVPDTGLKAAPGWTSRKSEDGQVVSDMYLQSEQDERLTNDGNRSLQKYSPLRARIALSRKNAQSSSRSTSLINNLEGSAIEEDSSKNHTQINMVNYSLKLSSAQSSAMSNNKNTLLPEKSPLRSPSESRNDKESRSLRPTTNSHGGNVYYSRTDVRSNESKSSLRHHGPPRARIARAYHTTEKDNPLEPTKNNNYPEFKTGSRILDNANFHSRESSPRDKDFKLPSSGSSPLRVPHSAGLRSQLDNIAVKQQRETGKQQYRNEEHSASIGNSLPLSNQSELKTISLRRHGSSSVLESDIRPLESSIKDKSMLDVDLKTREIVRPPDFHSFLLSHSELQSKLKAASVVMDDEKSSVGSSSSTRSSLSCKDLGSIATKALKLSTDRQTNRNRETRQHNSSLHRMLTEKRTRSGTSVAGENSKIATEISQIDQYSSLPPSDESSRLKRAEMLNRLKRAERFMALKTTFEAHEDEFTLGSSTVGNDWIPQHSTNAHPVFGFAKKGTSSTRHNYESLENITSPHIPVMHNSGREDISLKNRVSAVPLHLQSNSQGFTSSTESPGKAKGFHPATLNGHNRSTHEQDEWMYDAAYALREQQQAYIRGYQHGFPPSAEVHHEVLQPQHTIPVPEMNSKHRFLPGHFPELIDQQVEGQATVSLKQKNIFWPEEFPESKKRTAKLSSGTESGLEQKDNAKQKGLSNAQAVFVFHKSDLTLNDKISQIQNQENDRNLSLSANTSLDDITLLNENESFAPLYNQQNIDEVEDGSHSNGESASDDSIESFELEQQPVSPLKRDSARNILSKNRTREDDEEDVFFGLEECTPRSTFVSPVEDDAYVDVNCLADENVMIRPVSAPQVAYTNIVSADNGAGLYIDVLAIPASENTAQQCEKNIKNDSGQALPTDERKEKADSAQSLLPISPRKASRFRPKLEETIAEETAEDDRHVGDQAAPSQEDHDEDDTTVDVSLAHEDFDQPQSGQNPQPVRSMFLNLGCALVDTFKSSFPSACNVTVPTSNFRGDCAQTPAGQPNWMRASNSFDGQETVEGSTFKDGEALLSLTEPFVGQGVTYMEHLVSQNIVNIKNTDHPVWEDLETQASEDELHFELRRQAQQQLLKHAQNALSMHESKNRSDQQTESAVMSIKSLETLPNEPDYVEQLQESSLNGDVISPIASLEQQEVLERFISTLKNDGVEVLKLGRRNNWQIRYLTVSRESSSTGGHSPQFPRALLWLKQFKADTYSIDAIKVKGRGGVLFSQLMSVDLANTDSFYFTNADSFYQKILPKKFQPKFPTSCGVVLTYVYESGVRKLLLCFKNEGDAKSFCTSMRIIKKLSDKWADIEQSNAENMEIETFDTFPSKS